MQLCVLAPKRQNTAALQTTFVLPNSPCLQLLRSCRSGTLYFPILAEQPGLWIAIPHASKYQPMLSVLLCSAAAEGEQWSRSPGGPPWTRAGHMVGMGAVLQGWDCSSTAAKQKKGRQGEKEGEARGRAPRRMCCGQFAWAPRRLLTAALISSPWDPGMICCHMHRVPCFLSKKQAGIFRRDCVHSWAYLQVLGLFSGL